MKRRGRKKMRPGARESNGRLKRSAHPYEDVKAVALAQPHRRGNSDPLLECPLGQFILSYGLDRICYDAALAYARLLRRFFSIRGVPQPSTGFHVSRDVREMSGDVARAVARELEQVEKKLRKISKPGMNAVRQLAFFERALASGELDPDAARVLAALAV
jgi:hypothetical protein